MVAVHADLLTTQANLQIEREQSAMLRQEIANLQHLIDQVEVNLLLPPNLPIFERTHIYLFVNLQSLPDIESVKETSPESLVGDNLSSSSSSNVSETYTRLNHLLSALIAELLRMRNQAEEQSERLLRMQLIESQLAKTKRKCYELQAQLNSTTPAVNTFETAGSTHFLPLASVCQTV